VTAAPLPAERRRLGLSAKARSAFLEALAAGWSTTNAAELAGRHRRRFYDARERNTAFAEQWDEAVERGTDLIEDEIRRRAFEGWPEEVYQGGEMVGYVHRAGTKELLTLHRIRRPDLYRENQVVVPTVIVIESAFQGRPPIEAEVVESTAVELPEGDAA
jgi:hypothetical protein